MLDIPQALLDHLKSPTVAICYCIKIVRQDGVVFGFTDHDRDLLYMGVTYKTKSGFSASSIEGSSDLSVDNLEVEALIDDESLTVEDLKSGLFDGASVEVFLVCYLDLSMGHAILRSGWLGAVSCVDGNLFTTEVRGLTTKMTNRIGSVYTPTCRVERLGDIECNVSMSGRTKSSTVQTVTSRKTFTHNTNVQASNYFAHGILVWGAGSSNYGYESEVKVYTAANGVGTIELYLPTKKPILVGDAFSVTQGCDRTLAMCRDTFGNVINFRGEPYLPGVDAMLNIAG